MKIIIEGNDGVGKTTLAKRLQGDLNIKSYIHLSGKDPRDFRFYSTLLEKEDVIFDRSFIDEPIYSFVLGRECKLNTIQLDTLHKQVKANNIIVIICNRSDKLYDTDEENRIIAASKIIDDYFLSTAKNHDYIYYDTENDSYDELLAKLKLLVGETRWIQ